MYSSESISNVLWCIMNGITMDKNGVSIEICWKHGLVIVCADNGFDCRIQHLSQEDHNDDLLEAINETIIDLVTQLKLED